MNVREMIYLFILGMVLTNCATPKQPSASTGQTSVVTGETYDEKTDKTTLVIVPYGNVGISGKWEKINYNESSRQHFFINRDSVIIAIAKNPKEKYPFYAEGKKDFDLVLDFYKWDADHWEQRGLQQMKVKEDRADNFVIWKAQGEAFDNYFLYGLKNNIIVNYMIASQTWDENRKIEFLENIYKEN